MDWNFAFVFFWDRGGGKYFETVVIYDKTK